MLRELRLAMLAAAFALMSVPAAGAAPAGTADFTVSLYRTEAQPAGLIQARVDSLLQTHTLRVRRAANELARQHSAAGYEVINLSESTLRPGDVVELFRPMLADGPPSVDPTATYTIPAVSLTHAPFAVSGTVGEARSAALEIVGQCWRNESRSALALTGGAFSKEVVVSPGGRMRLHAYNGIGDATVIDALAPGETPCIEVDAIERRGTGTVDAEGRQLYRVNVGGLSGGTVRLVWRRGGEVLGDRSFMTPYGGLQSTVKPAAGDTIEVYRPQAAAQPAATYAVPAVGAQFDGAAMLLAVDTPSAGEVRSYLSVGKESPENTLRTTGLVPAGRTIVDYSVGAGRSRSAKPAAGQIAVVDWTDAAATLQYSLTAEPGDLVRPVASVIVAKRVKLAGLSRHLPVKVRSSESATVRMSLSVPRNLPSAKHPRKRASGPQRKLAGAVFSHKGGVRKVNLRFSTQGRKLIRRLRAAGTRLKPVTATLRLTAADSAGNTTTYVSTFRLVNR